jgi:hypothetical protein
MRHLRQSAGSPPKDGAGSARRLSIPGGAMLRDCALRKALSIVGRRRRRRRANEVCLFLRHFPRREMKKADS